MALEEAIHRTAPSIKLKRLAALDHSDVCVSVLEHNFPSSNKQKRKRPQSFAIERLTLNQVHEWHADAWFMSPPCQPHTRQHDNQEQDLEDPRSKSFLHLCQLLQDMEESKLPHILIMENVVGFELSGSCKRWRQVLTNRNYCLAHFHLTPTQVGLPNDRPRYFCVAVRRNNNDDGGGDGVDDGSTDWAKILSTETNLESGPVILTQLPELDILPVDSVGDLPPLSTFLDSTAKESLRVPKKLLESPAAWCFDIVTPDLSRTACFTHSYGKFVRGTGSVLYTGPPSTKLKTLQAPQDRVFDANWADGLDLAQHLRYFSGSEMAKLMGFSESFSFPSDCTPKQEWKLLGNSLNVRVAARLCELALRVWMKK